ncbi:hypothetical protein CRG98_009229 [Punica granatum]|uniref:Uncharacterized protein n=1 Tax=Punica granatum TaxID=22663 RepID=A0A2I0KPH6_PUNGR|nr:hypothetical protein CRG98_009229 [Punica granatum]
MKSKSDFFLVSIRFFFLVGVLIFFLVAVLFFLLVRIHSFFLVGVRSFFLVDIRFFFQVRGRAGSPYFLPRASKGQSRPMYTVGIFREEIQLCGVRQAEVAGWASSRIGGAGGGGRETESEQAW